jgi:photosystem II stability/assembly factor-like uncharacterized protein
MRRALFLLPFTMSCSYSAPTPDRAPSPTPNPVLSAQQSGTTSLLQAVSVVDENVVWVSGHQGTYAVTTDGGATWNSAQVPGADTLQFRDVHAFSADVAYLMGAGPADMSRIYKTTDRGTSWDLQWVNSEPSGFYDCMDFWDQNTAVTYGDAIEGELRLIRTTDGENWTAVSQDGLPAANGSEGGFAASGTCMVVGSNSVGWIGTGAGSAPRLLRTMDRGATWEAWDTPIIGGSSGAGITSIAFWDNENGMAFGGDLAISDAYTDNSAITSDGGKTWQLTNHPQFLGAVYGSAYVPNTAQPAVAVVGPNGLDFSIDLGTTWVGLDTLDYWAVGFAGPNAGWAVGPGGRITKIDLYSDY